MRGNWASYDFTADDSELNPQIKDTQFADYHGHGWNFRAVFKHDRKGNLLDDHNNVIPNDDPEKFEKAVHLELVHIEYGMHCVDCHFAQDAHGSGHIYDEVQAAIEITCADCHGTATKYPDLQASGPAAGPPPYNDLSLLRTSDGRARFEWRDGHLFQRSALYPGLEWQVTLVKDTVDPVEAAIQSARRAREAHVDGHLDEMGAGRFRNPSSPIPATRWRASPAICRGPRAAPAATCRSRPTGRPSGIITKAARRAISRHTIPQVARDDMFQLGIAGTIKGNIIAPIASRSALVLCSTNINRDHIYVQQAPTSSAGYSSQAFSAHYPHTERKDRDEDLHRLPRLGSERQQRDHGAAPALRHELRQFRRLRRLGRRGETVRRGTRHRLGRAAGGDRQLSAEIRLSRRLQGASRGRPRAQGSLRPRLERGALPAVARRISLCRRGHRRHARL